jgi:hypothetical protein
MNRKINENLTEVKDYPISLGPPCRKDFTK